MGVKEVQDLKSELNFLTDRVITKFEKAYSEKDSKISSVFTKPQLAVIMEIAKTFAVQVLLEYNAMDVDYNEPCPDDPSLLPLPPTEGAEI